MELPAKTVNKLHTILLASSMCLGIQTPLQALSFAGKSHGEWGIPENPNSKAVISLSSRNGGINNRLTWGTPEMGSFSNYVQFDGGNFNTTENRIFKVGDLSYRNGSTVVDTNFDGNFPLSLSLSLTLPLDRQETFSFLFNILNTPNDYGDPVRDGDRLRFSTLGATSHSFEYEGVDYTLELIGFSIDGGRTIFNEFNAPESTIARASLYGKITVASNRTAVPEPSILAALLPIAFLFVQFRKRWSLL